MSWNNTVRCSYCFNTGHNRRSCKELKQYVETHPDSYIAHARNTANRYRKINPRKCSYCGIAGHNRRTCAQISKDHLLLCQKLARRRSKLLEKMKESGIGVGTLIGMTSNLSSAIAKENFAVITGFDWKYENNPGQITPQVTFVKDANRYRRGLTLYLDINFHQSANSVLVEVDEKAILANIPLAWIEGKLYDEREWFPPAAPRCSWAYREEERG